MVRNPKAPPSVPPQVISSADVQLHRRPAETCVVGDAPEALWIHIEITASVPRQKLPQEPEVPGDSHPVPAPVGIYTCEHLQGTSKLRGPPAPLGRKRSRASEGHRDCPARFSPHPLTATAALLGPSKRVLNSTAHIRKHRLQNWTATSERLADKAPPPAAPR